MPDSERSGKRWGLRSKNLSDIRVPFQDSLDPPEDSPVLRPVPGSRHLLSKDTLFHEENAAKRSDQKPADKLETNDSQRNKPESNPRQKWSNRKIRIEYHFSLVMQSGFTEHR